MNGDIEGIYLKVTRTQREKWEPCIQELLAIVMVFDLFWSEAGTSATKQSRMEVSCARHIVNFVQRACSWFSVSCPGPQNQSHAIAWTIDTTRGALCMTSLSGTAFSKILRLGRLNQKKLRADPTIHESLTRKQIRAKIIWEELKTLLPWDTIQSKSPPSIIKTLTKQTDCGLEEHRKVKDAMLLAKREKKRRDHAAATGTKTKKQKSKRHNQTEDE